LMTYPNSKEPIPAPANLSEMINLSRKLCQKFSLVRVDFYNVDGKIYFGEMTFTSASGVDKFIPGEYDLKLGEMLSLPTKEESNAVL
ncbi:MAG: ATP-grasp fold amidoligase family protein, partial [Candidatus Gastranaerophilaceae bacterium]